MAGDSQVLYQVETGFGLKDYAARAIRDRIRMKSEDRTDYYADIYDGSAFLLMASPEGYKFRMKVKNGKKWAVQAYDRSVVENRRCAEGWPFSVRQKRIGGLTLSKEQGEYFSEAATAQLNMLSGNDTAGVVKNVRELQEFLLGLQVPLMDRLLATAAGKRWALTATLIGRKVKWKASLPGDSRIEVSITEGGYYLGSAFIRKKYDVEFQFEEEGLISMDDFSASVCSFMRDQGITDKDLDPDQAETGAQLETLKKLALFRDAILN
jgi:hypothetical protein